MSLRIDNQSPIGNSRWWLATISVPAALGEFVSALLFDLGSSGIVTLDENGDKVTLGAYFEEHFVARDIAQSIESELARAGHPGGLRSCVISAVPEEDWMQKWKEGFEAVQIGERLTVAPSWKLPKNNDRRVVIQIDPGMAFGTGTHETTRLCLEALERHWHGDSLLDVGTGTGILSIAGALLEPGSRVVGIDIDPHAVQIARDNVAINGLSNSIELFEGQPRDFPGQQFNVVVANLTAEVIVDLMPDLARCVAAEGLMILSGILSILAEEVQGSLAESGFQVTEQRAAGEWSALVAVKT